LVFPLNHQQWAKNTQDDLASRYPFVVLVALEYKLFMQNFEAHQSKHQNMKQMNSVVL
jgi:hypothetical protein